MLLFRFLLASACVAVLGLAGAAFAADTETADIPEGILAKMARISAKQSVDRGGKDGVDADDLRRRAGGSNPACGSLNVGNVDLGKRRIGAPPLREVTVIVKGDVINANNKCR